MCQLLTQSALLLINNDNNSLISRSDKAHYVLQTQTAGIKQDWCTDFMMAKLSLDRSNNLAWDGTSGSDSTDFDVTPAHFMKHLPVDVPKNYTKVSGFRQFQCQLNSSRAYDEKWMYGYERG